MISWWDWKGYKNCDTLLHVDNAPYDINQIFTLALEERLRSIYLYEDQMAKYM